MGTSGSVEIHYLYITECIVISAVYVLVKCLINLSSACCYHVLDEPAEYTQTGDLTNGNDFSVGEKPLSVVLFRCKINECICYYFCTRQSPVTLKKVRPWIVSTFQSVWHNTYQRGLSTDFGKWEYKNNLIEECRSTRK